MFLQISLSASKDHQDAGETPLGGALSRVSLKRLFYQLHGLNLAINFAGVPLLYETLWK
jgi:hypothetical protein